MAGGTRVFRDKILYAIIPIRGDAPLPLEIEIDELFARDQVAAVDFALLLQAAVLNRPALLLEDVFPDCTPVCRRFAVKQQLPARSGFFPGQNIGLGRKPKNRRDQRYDAR